MIDEPRRMGTNPISTRRGAGMNVLQSMWHGLDTP